MALMFPTVMLILNLSSVAAVWFGADRINAGQMQVGSLIAFLSYLIQILMAVMMATFVAMMGPRAAVCAERIEEVLDTAAVGGGARPTPSPSCRCAASLELRHVEFSYPGAEQPVLDDITFRVDAGRDARRSSAAPARGRPRSSSLVPRLFDATAGSVLVDGVDVRELDPETLWSRIGLVPQKPFLFSGTVASNVRFGKPGRHRRRAVGGARGRAGARLRRGDARRLDAPIAQGGTNVSGGQRQRLAIARALAQQARHLPVRRLVLRPRPRHRRPPARRADAGHADAAVVIVAQRVSTIMQADQILVLEEGRIVGLGTHHELLETCPTYDEIVESQIVAEEAA